MVRSLFLLPFASNPGYAISPLGFSFTDWPRLADSDSSDVHFGYQSFLGDIEVSSSSFDNLIEFDVRDRDRSNAERLIDMSRRTIFVLFLHSMFNPFIHFINCSRQAVSPPWLHI